jgi:hypothetical protein
VKPCPACKEDKAKLRTESLGEPKGVWCTACGRSTDSVEAWESAWRGAVPIVDEPHVKWVVPPTSRSLIQNDYDRRYVASADADQLTRAGDSIGRPRLPRETDEQYRERLLA